MTHLLFTKTNFRMQVSIERKKALNIEATAGFSLGDSDTTLCLSKGTTKMVSQSKMADLARRNEYKALKTKADKLTTKVFKTFGKRCRALERLDEFKTRQTILMDKQLMDENTLSPSPPDLRVRFGEGDCFFMVRLLSYSQL